MLRDDEGKERISAYDRAVILAAILATLAGSLLLFVVLQSR